MNAPSTSVRCPKCQISLAHDARFCAACGTALSPTEPNSYGNNPLSDSQKLLGRDVAGRYRILAKLGEGGMGAVYRAEQISLKREVALKVLKPELSTEPGLVRRFNAEAELAAKLKHPNTVTLYDFGQDSDGSLFIAMEFLEGLSLRHVLHRGGPMAPARAIAICEQVCASLADAHSHGIVHRDLKPDNVMLIRVGKREDVVRVLDFGIAKLRDEQGNITAMPMTQAGDMLGTPQYMAPEQIRGERVDARTDVYALGAMLYEMVTGRLPFEGPSLMSILSKHLTDMPEAPEVRRPDLGIPGPLSALVMQALRKRPEERPPSMEVFAERLGELAQSLSSGSAVAAAMGQPALGLSSAYRLKSYPPQLHASPPPGVPLAKTPPPELVPYGSGTGHPGSNTPPPAGYGSPPPRDSGHAPSLAQAAPASQTGADSRARKSRAGLWIALSVTAAAATGAIVFFAMRNADDGEEEASAESAAASASTDTASVSASFDMPANSATVPVAQPTSDFDVEPVRPLYGGDANSATSSGSAGAKKVRGTKPPAAPRPDPAPNDDDDHDHGDPVGGWQGGWWRMPTGSMSLDIPRGFSVGSMMGVPRFVGDCGGVTCDIRAVDFPTGGEVLDIDELWELVHSGGIAGQGTDVRRQRVGGRACVTLVFPNPDEGLKGLMVLCPKGTAVPAITIQAKPAQFGRTAAFRREFLSKRVRF